MHQICYFEARCYFNYWFLIMIFHCQKKFSVELEKAKESQVFSIFQARCLFQSISVVSCSLKLCDDRGKKADIVKCISSFRPQVSSHSEASKILILPLYVKYVMNHQSLCLLECCWKFTNCRHFFCSCECHLLVLWQSSPRRLSLKCEVSWKSYTYLACEICSIF